MNIQNINFYFYCDANHDTYSNLFLYVPFLFIETSGVDFMNIPIEQEQSTYLCYNEITNGIIETESSQR